MGRRVKVFASALALLLIGLASALLGGSSAEAAAPPVVIGSCATTIQGTPGQPVSLSTGAVLGVVTNAVRAVPILGPPLAASAGSAFSALPPIPIGAIPNGTGTISGATIANAVVAQLRGIPLLGPVIATVAGSVQSTLTNMCGVTVTGVNAAAAPVQDGAKAAADASQGATGGIPGVPAPGGGTGLPGTGGSPATGGSGGATQGGTGASGGSQSTGGGANSPVVGGIPAGDLGFGDFLGGTGRSPMADYGSIPFARPGLFAPSPGVRYGGAVTGYSPQFGILGTDDKDGVQAAGNAEALHMPSSSHIAFPVLLAVFALSGVTAVLVRTWVLRRAPAV